MLSRFSPVRLLEHPLLPHTPQKMVGGPALSSGVNSESHTGPWVHPRSSFTCKWGELTLQGMSDSETQGRAENQQWPQLYWRDLGEVCLASKKETPKERDLSVSRWAASGYGARSLMAGLLSTYESQRHQCRSQRPQLWHLESSLPLDCLLQEKTNFLLAEAN